MSDKVTEIAGIDINDDGKEEVVIGDDSGKVAIFTENGTRNNLPSRSQTVSPELTLANWAVKNILSLQT